MSCAAIMTANPTRVRDSDSLAEAAAALAREHGLDLPVVDEAGRFVGMFGLYDLLSLLVPRVALAGDLTPNLRFVGDDMNRLRTRFESIRTRPVGACCERQCVTLAPDSEAIEALRLFCHRHTRLAVVDPGSRMLVGVVSWADAITALAGEVGD